MDSQASFILLLLCIIISASVATTFSPNCGCLTWDQGQLHLPRVQDGPAGPVNKIISICMPIHSNKYYQLIKVLRVQKQRTEEQKLLHCLKREKQLQLHDTHISEHIIAAVIDRDSAFELEDRDKNRADKQSLLPQTHSRHTRMWEAFLKDASFLTVTAESLPMQRKIAFQKDEQLIDSLLKEGDAAQEGNNRQLEGLTYEIRRVNEGILELQHQTHELEKEKEQCQRLAVKLKSDFDAEDKKINERSSKYKVEKSTDLMFKNIDKEDQQMRKAMASRIKLNQELDFGFQIQRRRAFNQAKQANNVEKQKIMQSLGKLSVQIQAHRSQQLKLKQNRLILEGVNSSIRKQTVYFLKQLIKQFQRHSKGIEWMVRLLINFKQKITRSDLPQNLTTDDRRFIEELFATEKAHPLASKRPTHMSMIDRVNYRPRSRDLAGLEAQFKTQPNVVSKGHSEKHFSCFERTKTEMKQTGEMTVHFDIENAHDGGQSTSGTPRAGLELSQRVNLNSKSLKKIYESTGEMISKLVKNKDWNYESCKVMTAPTEEPINTHCGKAEIEEKIRLRFSSVRQMGRRNNVRRLLFGDKQKL